MPLNCNRLQSTYDIELARRLNIFSTVYQVIVNGTVLLFVLRLGAVHIKQTNFVLIRRSHNRCNAKEPVHFGRYCCCYISEIIVLRIFGCSAVGV